MSFVATSTTTTTATPTPLTVSAPPRNLSADNNTHPTNTPTNNNTNNNTNTSSPIATLRRPRPSHAYLAPAPVRSPYHVLLPPLCGPAPASSPSQPPVSLPLSDCSDLSSDPHQHPRFSSSSSPATMFHPASSTASSSSSSSSAPSAASSASSASSSPTSSFATSATKPSATSAAPPAAKTTASPTVAPPLAPVAPSSAAPSTTTATTTSTSTTATCAKQHHSLASLKPALAPTTFKPKPSSAASVTAATVNSASSSPAGKKVRAPKCKLPGESRYWTPSEHKLFVEALVKYGPKNLKAISAHVGTRNMIQCRTHEQKYFLRLMRKAQRETMLRNGELDHVPDAASRPLSHQKVVYSLPSSCGISLLCAVGEEMARSLQEQ